MELKFTVTEEDNGLNVKEFLYKKGLSVTLVKKAKQGGIYVCSNPVTVRKTLSLGDTVKIIVPDQGENNIEPIEIPLNVVYEDDFVLVVDKPTNMPTHPSRGNSLPTLANAVIAKMGRDFTFRAINRLDRDTSGLVLIAKDTLSAAKLSASMKNGEFSKKYLAIVEGVPEMDSDLIDAPIEREAEDSIKRTVRADGKRALTEYRILENRGNTALLEVTLHTGRTHQIRVHLSYIGHPLVGDFLYGERSDEGYFLRCHKLSFPHPISGELISLSI